MKIELWSFNENAPVADNSAVALLIGPMGFDFDENDEGTAVIMKTISQNIAGIVPAVVHRHPDCDVIPSEMDSVCTDRRVKVICAVVNHDLARPYVTNTILMLSHIASISQVPLVILKTGRYVENDNGVRWYKYLGMNDNCLILYLNTFCSINEHLEKEGSADILTSIAADSFTPGVFTKMVGAICSFTIVKFGVPDELNSEKSDEYEHAKGVTVLEKDSATNLNDAIGRMPTAIIVYAGEYCSIPTTACADLYRYVVANPTVEIVVIDDLVGSAEINPCARLVQKTIQNATHVTEVCGLLQAYQVLFAKYARNFGRDPHPNTHYDLQYISAGEAVSTKALVWRGGVTTEGES